MHPGFRGCSAEFLRDFLRSTECESLYLVGDVIDIWSMRKRPFRLQAHNDVVRTILGKAKRGTKVVFVPGNHDELPRDSSTGPARGMGTCAGDPPGDMMRSFSTANSIRPCPMLSGERSEATDRDS